MLPAKFIRQSYNGNLTADANKNISVITYNYLNLPQAITVAGKGTITYTYDAAGNKLKKVTVDNTASPSKTTTTLYLSGAVYENDVLQFIAHEEGRTRPIRDVNNNITGFANDYFLKDHLGNIRMVLTDENKSDPYPPASMETAQAVTEEALYANISETRVDKPAGYPTDSYTVPNDKVAKVNGNENKIGPSIILKVMAGDKFNLRVSSWYRTNGSSPGSPNNIASDLVAGFLNSLSGVSGFGHGSAALAYVQNSGIIPTAMGSFLNTQPPPETGTGKPKAYVNWVLLDEQFKFVENSSSAEPVGADQEFKIHVKEDLPVTKNGYLYVFVSNESPNIDVYFDNLQITHVRGPILEETHYYPFGLTMAGISSKVLQFGGAENRFKYNGKEEQRREFSDGSGLEWLDYGARMYDNQLGRWHVIDNYSEVYYGLTPYNYAGNTPINAIDVDGNLFIFANGFMLDHWRGGSNPTTKNVDGSTSPNSYYYNPDRGFYEDGPRNNGKTFSYWDGVDRAYIKYNSNFEGEKALYTNGSFTPKATANARYNEGMKAAEDLIAKLDAREITLKDGETIKIIGHSQGAAYAAGIATGLLGSKYGSLIEFVDYLSPHQPGDIRHPTLVQGRQFSTKEDRISSKGNKAKWFGGSKYEKIPGAEWGIDRDDYDGGYRGHMVNTWLNDLVNYWRGLGIKVTVHE